MGFKVEKVTYQNRTYRMPEDLLRQCGEVANKHNISINELTIQCVRYALNNIEDMEETNLAKPSEGE